MVDQLHRFHNSVTFLTRLLVRRMKHEVFTLRFVDKSNRIQNLILNGMSEHGYDTRSLFAVQLALDESLANAIRHGNAQDPSKVVLVRYSVDDDQVWIEVEDEGDGFCPSDLPDPRLPENVDQPSGRGVFLLRSFMCSVAYNQRGNCVTLIKKRQRSDAEMGLATAN